MQTLIAYNFGAKEYERTKKILLQGMFAAFVFLFIGFLLTRFFPDIFVNIFTKDAVLEKICLEGIKIYLITLPLLGVCVLGPIYFQSIGKIKQYDQKYNSELLQTAIVYVKLGGNIKNTAKSINLHENTVRYRINKIKEIFNTTNSEFEFYEELALGIKLHLIHQNI